MNQTQIGKGSEKVVDEFVRQIGKVSITAWAMPMWHRRRRPLVGGGVEWRVRGAVNRDLFFVFLLRRSVRGGTAWTIGAWHRVCEV